MIESYTYFIHAKDTFTLSICDLQVIGMEAVCHFDMFLGILID